MKLFWIISCALSGVVAAGPMLFENGSSDYVIAVAPDAPLPERHAAEELQKYIELCSGATLPLVDAANGRPALLVGRGPAVEALLPELNWKELSPDEVVLKKVGGDLVISGGRPRGVMYAADIFIEEALGVRWWTPDATHIPQLARFELPELDYRYRPPFASRDAYYRNAVFHPLFATKLKMNGHMQRIPDELGGNIKFLGWCHTFGQLIPAERYFEEHPEWFSLVAGKRVPNGQLCLTNPEMTAELIRNAGQWLVDNPGQLLISISQNDCGMACGCPGCAAFVAANGNQSDLLIDFVNRVAAELEATHPGVTVETLAYQYTVAVPKTLRPRANVLIRLCTINANQAEPLDGPANAKFRDLFAAWSGVAGQLAVWNYLANFSNYLSPQPNWRNLAADLRTMAAHRTIAVFEQGDADSAWGGDLNDLRTWLLGKLMWNPALDQTLLMEEFIAGYYGDAAPYVRRYLGLVLDELYANPKPALDCYLQDTGGWLSLAGLLEMRRNVAEGVERFAADPVLSDRLGRIALMLDFTLLNRFEVTRYSKDAAAWALLADIDLDALLDRTFARGRELPIHSYREGGLLSALEQLLRNRVGRPEATATPEICRGVPDRDWVAIPFENAVLFGDFLAEDPAANGGKALRMRNDFYSWLVQLYIPRFADGRPRDFYLRCRASGQPHDGDAFETGLYDTASTRGVFTFRGKSASIFGDRYVYVKIGSAVPGGSSYVFITPIMNPAAEQYLWVDDLVLIAR